MIGARRGVFIGFYSVCCTFWTSRSYDLGEDITLCWATPPGAEPVRENCNGANVAFTGTWPLELISGETYSISYIAQIPVETSVVTHANIHSCTRSVGFCTPFVENTPKLSTHSTALTSVVMNREAVFTSEVVLPGGQYTMIAHVRWEDSDMTVHDMSRARIADVEDASTFLIYGLIIMGVTLAVAIALVVSYVSWRLVKYHRRLRKVARREYDARVERVNQAYRQTKYLAFPMCCISYLDFKEQGELISHEDARCKGLLHSMDTVEDILEADESWSIFFVSHQWTDTSYPDPRGDHFRAITAAVDTIAAEQGLDFQRLLIWIDYTSIPQRACSLQNLSINSLPVYASYSSHFLAVAPLVQNEASAPIFTLQSYEARGWCRLEQWARITQRSLDNMFICQGANDAQGPAVPVKDHSGFADKAMHVFRGNFTMEEDRYKLIDTVVGLYLMLLENERDPAWELASNVIGKMASHASGRALSSWPSNPIAISENMGSLLERVRKNRETVFPKKYFEDLVEIADDIGGDHVRPQRALSQKGDIEQSTSRIRSVEMPPRRSSKALAALRSPMTPQG